MLNKISELEREIARLNTDFKISAEGYNRGLDRIKDELQKIKDTQEEKRESNGRWKPELYKSYFIVKANGFIEEVSNLNNDIDDFFFDSNNFFKRKEEAEQHLKNIKTKNKLRALAEELNDNRTINWSTTEQVKYYLYYDNENKSICLGWKYYKQVGSVIYCLDSNFKDKAIELIGEQRLIEMIKAGV